MILVAVSSRSLQPYTMKLFLLFILKNTTFYIIEEDIMTTNIIYETLMGR